MCIRDRCIKWLEENEDIAVFSFANVKDKLNLKEPRYPGYEKRPQVGEYKLNFQGAIWNREKLMKYVREHETPWEFETIGSMRTFNSKDLFYVISDEKESPINYGKKPGLTWGIVRGKWVVEDVKELFEKNGIAIDYSIRGELKKEDLEEFDKNNQQGEFLSLIHIFSMDNKECAKGIANVIKDKQLQKILLENMKKSDYTNLAEVKKLYELIE